MHRRTRRGFLGTLGAAPGLVLVGCGSAFAEGPEALELGEPVDEEPEGEESEAERPISATEDLMREHGVIDRLLLIYDESRRRLEGEGDFDAEVLGSAATLVQHFVERYHEKNEEDFVFPRMERTGRLVELVGVLRAQHAAGRQLTELILRQTEPGEIPADPLRLANALESFVAMYRPHSAREDTVLFPAWAELLESGELFDLGERFETLEHAHLGQSGFEGVVREVAELERALGIHDLERFTPEVPEASAVGHRGAIKSRRVARARR